ncbi:MAG TPA: thiopeptide-type bacteriocin biosynthesis protein [Streptosporangiaceae bacterium]|nr:thiopeptide-type bacteriocin biosynthesis protein [Streptosporangiaceae bacterium]
MADAVMQRAEDPARRARVASLAQPPWDWLYYRISVADDLETNRLLLGLVNPAIARFRAEVPALRWFFLRFLDQAGLHVRLRLRATLAETGRIQRYLDDRLSAAQAAVHGGGGEVTCREFHKALYAPETVKYGPGPGIELAERLFQASSDAALALLDAGACDRKVACTAAHMMLMLAGLPREERIGFLHQYAWYWSGGPSRRWEPGALMAAIGGDGRDRAAQLAGAAADLLADPLAGRLLARYATAAWRELRSPERRRVPRSDSFLLFHHIHLMNNRLGVFRPAEAAIARLLWHAELAGRSPGCTPRSPG